MKNMLNLSNHTLGLNQIEELEKMGYVIVELSPELKAKWGQLTPFNYREVCNEAIEYGEQNNCTALHVAGFPAAVNLICQDLLPSTPAYYAFSERQTVEVEVEGQVVKKSIFKHIGFFEYDKPKR